MEILGDVELGDEGKGGEVESGEGNKGNEVKMGTTEVLGLLWRESRKITNKGLVLCRETEFWGITNKGLSQNELGFRDQNENGFLGGFWVAGPQRAQHGKCHA